jgi:hypothetical protein
LVLRLPEEVEATVTSASLSTVRVQFEYKGTELVLVAPRYWVQRRHLKDGARFEYGGGMFYVNGYRDSGQLMGVCTKQEVGQCYLNGERRGLLFDPEMVTPLEATR